MQREGSIAAFGNAGGHELPTSVLPFTPRALNLLGINTGYFDDALRQRLWARMATDLRPDHLDRMTSTIGSSGKVFGSKFRATSRATSQGESGYLPVNRGY